MKMWHLNILCYIYDTVSSISWQYCVNRHFTDKSFLTKNHVDISLFKYSQRRRFFFCRHTLKECFDTLGSMLGRFLTKIWMKGWVLFLKLKICSQLARKTGLTEPLKVTNQHNIDKSVDSQEIVPMTSL